MKETTNEARIKTLEHAFCELGEIVKRILARENAREAAPKPRPAPTFESVSDKLAEYHAKRKAQKKHPPAPYIKHVLGSEISEADKKKIRDWINDTYEAEPYKGEGHPPSIF